VGEPVRPLKVEKKARRGDEMVDRISGIIEKYGSPEIKKALEKKAAESSQAEAKRADQTSRIARSDITYDSVSVVRKAQAISKTEFSGLVGRELTADEAKRVDEFARALARGVIEEVKS
jgi:hypothetical protein